MWRDDELRRTGFVQDWFDPRKWHLRGKGGLFPKQSGFDGFSPFQETRAWVNIGGRPAFESREWSAAWMSGAALGGKWGVINRAGRFIVEPRFDGETSFHEERAFGNVGGSARASHGFVAYWFEGGRWALLDRDGRELVPPLYEAVRTFAGGVAWVKHESRWGLIDGDGKWKIEPRFDEVPSRSESHKSFVEGVEPVAIGGKWGLVDREGKWVLSPTHDHIFDFRGGFARVVRWLDDPDPDEQVARSGLFGFIDARGVLIHPVTLSRASDFVRRKASVAVEGKEATLDREGRLTFSKSR